MTGIQGNTKSKLKCENIEIIRRKSKKCCLRACTRKENSRTFKFNMKTLFGILIGMFGIIIIYLNETYAIDFTIHYNKVINNVVEVDGLQFNKDNDGKLIYVFGTLQVDEPLTDPEYGVSIQCVKLKQRVQMFQWVEKIINNQHIYEGEWKSKLINSKAFLHNETHKNPTSFPMESRTFVNEYVRVGEYYMSREFKDEFNDFVQITSDERPENKNIKMHFGLYYHSENVWKPEIGDIRVQFSYAGLHEETISIVGKQVGRYIYPYYNISNGYHVKYIKFGQRKYLSDILHVGHLENIWTIRVFRLIAIVFIFLSSHCIFQHYRKVTMFNLFISISTTSIITSYVWYWNYPTFSGKILLTATLSPIILSTLFGRHKFSMTNMFR